MAGTRLWSSLSFLAFVVAAGVFLSSTVVVDRAPLPPREAVDAVCARPPGSTSPAFALSRRLLPVRPHAVHFAFKLAHEGGDSVGSTAWDFERDVEPHLAPVLDAVRTVVDVTVSSQQVLYAKLGRLKPAKGGEPGFTVSEQTLGGFLSSNDWDLGAAVDNDGAVVINVVAFVPGARHRPTTVTRKGGKPSTSFALSRFGGIVIVNDPQAATVWRDVAAGFSAHLQRFIGLPVSDGAGAVSPPEDVLLMQQDWLYMHAGEACSALHSALAIAGAMPHMQVSGRVSDAAHAVVESMGVVASKAEAVTRLTAVRDARRAADVVARDPDMVPQLYFPPLHLAAVYLPLWAPLALPLMLSVWKATKEYVGKRRR